MENFESEEKNKRKVDNLINLVENHTRTERHLEQYSYIGNQDNKENARQKQDIRDGQIQELKEQLINPNDKTNRQEQLENVKERYKSVQNYLENNYNSMTQEELNNIKEKQENRKNQIDNLG